MGSMLSVPPPSRGSSKIYPSVFDQTQQQELAISPYFGSTEILPYLPRMSKQPHPFKPRLQHHFESARDAQTCTSIHSGYSRCPCACPQRKLFKCDEAKVKKKRTKCVQTMTLYVRLRGPQVTLQRRKRGCSLIPRFRSLGFLQSLSLMFLSVAVASVGFFLITEVKIAQKAQGENKLLTKVRRSTSDKTSPTIFTPRDDFFKIAPLLNKSTPSVELSAQIALNRLYSINNKIDILRYYNWIRCKAMADDVLGRNETKCNKFSLVWKTSDRVKWWSMKFCSLYPPNLVGQKTVPTNQFLPINQMDAKALAAIKPGGWWEPPDCIPRHSVAIVIPYKNRWHHLTTLLNHLHPLLQRQQLRYKLFVVEQYGSETFNKGIVMNAGFLEALKEELFHCFIFHDVDLIPENDNNMYSCPDMPRHLSIAVNELQYRLPYLELVGGAFAIRTDHFFRVNGYSNFFWGWGGEDDDMGIRVQQSGLKIIRPLPHLGRYTMIRHVKRKPSDPKIRWRLLATSKKRYRLEGLNSVQYKLIKKKEYPWFTTFLVDIGKPHPSFRLDNKFANSRKTYNPTTVLGSLAVCLLTLMK